MNFLEPPKNIKTITALPVGAQFMLIGLGENNMPYQWNPQRGSWDLIVSAEILKEMGALDPFPGIKEDAKVQDAVFEEVVKEG